MNHTQITIPAAAPAPPLPFTQTDPWAYQIVLSEDGPQVVASDPRGRHAGEIHLQREARARAALGSRSDSNGHCPGRPIPVVPTTGRHQPRYGWRGLHVDAARRFIPAPVLCQLIDCMDQARLNVLNLHISENEGYRLPSRRHPEVSSPQHLSFEDVETVRQYAADRHITIVPSFDLPGHLDTVLRAHPWAQLQGEEGPIRGALDITNAKAVELAWDLLDEVIEIFDAKWVNIGGDEYLDFRQGVPALRRAAQEKLGPAAREHDLWVDFLNTTNRRLRERGIEVFMWNDGVHGDRIVDPDTDMLIHYWTRWGAHMTTATEFAERGHVLVNWDGELLYFVLRDDPDNTYPTAESVFAYFDPDIYPGKGERVRLPGQLGAVFSIWCDAPEAITDAELLELTHGPIMAFGQALWPVSHPRNSEELMTQFPPPVSPAN